MHAKLIWKENLQFTAEADGHVVLMDAKPPVGQGKARRRNSFCLPPVRLHSHGRGFAHAQAAPRHETLRGHSRGPVREGVFRLYSAP